MNCCSLFLHLGQKRLPNSHLNKMASDLSSMESPWQFQILNSEIVMTQKDHIFHNEESNEIVRELEKQLELIFTHLHDVETLYVSTDIVPILQKGPTCGLVALYMGTQKNKNRMKPIELLNVAKLKGFTNHGEMYSVDYMYDLILSTQNAVKIRLLDDIKSRSNQILDELKGGSLILIAYDADHNHQPCKKKGHKAHWALLIGMIATKCKNYVLARHGKSRRVACWLWEDLLDSNMNLEEASPVRREGGYVLPEGGVGGSKGLKDRLIVLYSNEPTHRLIH
ncbi:UPF0692 protein CG33108 isoform X1 [Trichogramma pretiosum]|uniref:UPF0692 protein CG33108 isoform X1 n=2 Tax=Trichogramma pretiosum TaxID=7493 RepID=UPI0006C94918|nr:UPF0692 protein CG33108 isoform X1 [Trichogramma pretiosum]